MLQTGPAVVQIGNLGRDRQPDRESTCRCVGSGNVYSGGPDFSINATRLPLAVALYSTCNDNSLTPVVGKALLIGSSASNTRSNRPPLRSGFKSRLMSITCVSSA